ncbi:MAG: alpha/beta fold hydrolase [Anaerolineae bacterium]
MTTTHAISRYLNVRQAYFSSFTSDGRHIAFLTNITGTVQVWQVALPFGSDDMLWPDQLTFDADRVMGVWCSPAPGDGRLIYARDVGGNENAQLFLLSADGAVETPLTAGHEGAMHIFGEWSADGSQVLFAANRRHAGLFDLYVQLLDGEARLVWRHEEPGFLFNMSFSPDGRHAVATRMSSSFRHDLFEIDLAAGTARTITPSAEDARYTALSYASDGRSLFVNTDLGAEFLHLARLDLATLALEPIVVTEWNTELMTRSPDGRHLAYAVNVDGASGLCLLDLTNGVTRTAPGFGAAQGVVGMMDAYLAFSPDSSRLAFSFTSATRTSDVFVWDLETDQVRAVTRSSHAGLPLDSFIQPELIHYPTFDSDGQNGRRQIPAWFYKPAGNPSEPMPAIIAVHGGPEGQFRPYFHFFIQYFLQNGYAVLAPNVRGSTGYGKTYSHLDNVEKRMDSVADLAHAAYWLREQPSIDANRLVVYGGSYGGFMVLAAMTTYPDLWAAGVDIVGISNFVTFLENTSEYRRAHREAEYGSLERDREFMESIAPINHVDKITAPLMVIHGANDPRVPVSEAEQLVAALKARGVPVEFLVFDDEGHGLVKLKNKQVAYPAIVEFLNTHLSSR